VVITVKAEGDELVIKVENNGATLTAGSSDLMLKGLGLSNLNDRLKNLYGTDYFFEIRNKAEAGEGVETVVRVPL
jgi:two-component system, LytTR family, sensor kinase